MHSSMHEFSRQLLRDIAEPTTAYVNRGVDEDIYIEGLRQSVREAMCEPYPLEATVLEPAFPFAAIGDTLKGYCVAKRSGYWLVRDPLRRTYYAFWGTVEDRLGAHGVFGDPLYCWSA